jgi:hypothetical protein
VVNPLQILFVITDNHSMWVMYDWKLSAKGAIIGNKATVWVSNEKTTEKSRTIRLFGKALGERERIDSWLI